jgi:hypothetical protein
MKSLADGLPPEIARQIHPDWRKNEAAYWAVRDQLLTQYLGKWIGFEAGTVVASGDRPVVVFHAAHKVAEHPYVICVGREDEPYRIRRATFPYDLNYPGEALTTLGFLVWVFLDGAEYQCQLHADFVGRERILGRDVLNSIEVLFRGPSCEVVVNP